MARLKLFDGLTRAEAESEVRKLRTEEGKLRQLGGRGNYAVIEYAESYRRGFTLDDRPDKVRFAVFVTPHSEVPNV